MLFRSIIIDGKSDSGSQMLYALKIFYGADTQIPEDIVLEALNDAHIRRLCSYLTEWKNTFRSCSIFHSVQFRFIPFIYGYNIHIFPNDTQSRIIAAALDDAPAHLFCFIILVILCKRACRDAHEVEYISIRANERTIRLPVLDVFLNTEPVRKRSEERRVGK